MRELNGDRLALPDLSRLAGLVPRRELQHPSVAVEDAESVSSVESGEFPRLVHELHVLRAQLLGQGVEVVAVGDGEADQVDALLVVRADAG